jgi:hypothetical protein
VARGLYTIPPLNCEECRDLFPFSASGWYDSNAPTVPLKLFSRHFEALATSSMLPLCLMTLGSARICLLQRASVGCRPG